MKIKIADIKYDGLDFEKKAGPDELGLDEKGLNFKCLGPVLVKSKIERVDNENIIARTRVSGRFSIECGKCLEDISRDLTRKFILSFEVNPHDETIDLGEEIRQEVIMSFSNILTCDHLFKDCAPDQRAGSCKVKDKGHEARELQASKTEDTYQPFNNLKI